MSKDNVIAVILGGGAGTRLFPLTELRAKPAVPLAGKYRLVDIPVSNCINSDILRIYILTQFNSASLNRHIARTYRMSRFSNGFVEVLAAEITPHRSEWYQGTADAVRQSFPHFDDSKCDTVIVLSGDHLYRMDYRKFIAHHRHSGADVTLSVTAVGEADASSYGLVKVDDRGRVLEFREKPARELLPHMRVDTTFLGLSAEEADRRPYLASMGIYVFRKEVLHRLLMSELKNAVDFGRDVLPAALWRAHVTSYLFDGYWEDIGTIGAFYRANLALTEIPPAFSFFDSEAPMYTRARFLPGSKILDCLMRTSILSEGCILKGSAIQNSIIGIRSRIEAGSAFDGVLMMGADFYQTPEEVRADIEAGLPRVGVGPGCTIKRAIIDKNARIGGHVKITNEGGRDQADGDGWYIRDGIVIIPKNGLVPEGTVI